MNRLLSASMLALALAAGIASRGSAADIGPKPLDYAGQPTPLRDMKGIEVEMASEDVKLVLTKTQLEVEAAFNMVNRGGDVEFEEGFPVGAFKSMTGFSITMDGAAVPFKLVDRASADPTLDRSKEKDPDYFGDDKKPRREKPADFWYVWNASFKKDGRHLHMVKYAVSLEHQHFYHETGYILHTGAAWKNAIGKAVVTLTLGSGVTIEHLRQVHPLDAARYEADRVVWTFENLEPTKDHDIRIRYASESWKAEIEKDKKEAASSWNARRAVACDLKLVPAYQGRKTFAPSELKEYLDALAALVSEAKIEDGKFVMPACDPERVSAPPGVTSLFQGMMRPRYYVLESTLWDMFGEYLDEALAVARDNPSEPKAKEILRSYREFFRHLLAGDLYLDYRPLAVNAKIAAERNIHISGRKDPKEGKIVLADRVPDEKRKVLEPKLADAEALLK
jgi:hypothetical protein